MPPSIHPLRIAGRRVIFAAFFALLASSVLLRGAIAEPAAIEAERVEFFEKKIRPLLSSHCFQCHSADTKPSGELRVDDRNGLLVGGHGGPALVPGKPE